MLSGILLLSRDQERLLHGPGGFTLEGREERAEHHCLGVARFLIFGMEDPTGGIPAGQEERQEFSKNPGRQVGHGVKMYKLRG